MNSQALPSTQPPPAMTLPRMKAPGRISVPAPIQAGPMIVAYGGSFTEGSIQTLPSTWTPGGTLAGSVGASVTDARAAVMFLSQSQGGASAGKKGANRASDGGKAKNSEAFTAATVAEKPAGNQRFLKVAPTPEKQKAAGVLIRRPFEMERAKRLVLSTSTLARWCSTN